MGSKKDFFGKKEGSFMAATIWTTISAVCFIFLQSHVSPSPPAAYYFVIAFVLMLGMVGIVNFARALNTDKNNGKEAAGK